MAWESYVYGIPLPKAWRHLPPSEVLGTKKPVFATKHLRPTPKGRSPLLRARRFEIRRYL